MIFEKLIYFSRFFLQHPANPDLLYIIFFCHSQLTITILLCLIFASKVGIAWGYNISLFVSGERFFGSINLNISLKSTSINMIGKPLSTTRERKGF